MSTSSPTTAILLISCPDQTGIVAAVSGFITENRGNIVHLDQHVDSADAAFFMRVEWEVDSFAVARGEIEDRIRLAYLLAVCREADKYETTRVKQLHAQLKQLYTKDAEAAKQLLAGSPPPGVALDEAAAWIAVARTILNLDEVITRE